MKKIATLAVASLFAAGVTGTAIAQEKTHSETTTKQTGPGPDMKTKSETVTGTVKSYSAGESIKVEGPGERTTRSTSTRRPGSTATSPKARW